jgi:hypothetical protein
MKEEIDKKVTLPTYSHGRSKVKVIDMFSKDRKTNQKDYYSEDVKEIKKDVNNMVRFFNKQNMVVVKELDYYQKLALENDFQELKPKHSKQKNGDHTLEFRIKDKNKAKEVMRQIKENLTDIIIQEREGADLIDVSEESYHGIGNYDKRSYLG